MQSARRGLILSGLYLFFVAVAVFAVCFALMPVVVTYAESASGSGGSGGSDGGSGGGGGGDHGDTGSSGDGTASVSDVSINGSLMGSSDVAAVGDRLIIIKVIFTGLATDYRISEDPTFAGTEWTSIPGFGRPAIEIKYTLSEGSGIKTIYFQAKRNATIANVIKIQVKLS